MIFVDTSFWVAMRNRRDPWHRESCVLFEERAGSALITSNHVQGETWTYLRRKAGHGSAVDFLDTLQGSELVSVMPIASELEAEALRWLRRHDEREYSFVDATSFALMRSMRLTEVLAFDGDFSANGFVELRE